MIYTIIIYILFSHFVADFIMQTHEMATGKSNSIYWLTRHILSYGKTFFVSSLLFIFIAILCGYDCVHLAPLIILYIFMNMALHWVTDYFTSKQTKKYFSKNDYHNGFVWVGLDQFIHQITLITTFYCIFIH
jgi:hypothetical protein